MNPEHRPPRYRWLACALALSTALSPAPALAQGTLPALGESASDDLSIGAERRLGQEIMREGRRDPQYLDDPLLLEYLEQIWRPLVAAARARGEVTAETDQAFAWEAFLVRDRSVNAFALPGGYVGVHLGLIALTSAPDQLASVLAHELTHITQRHIARSIAPQRNASLLSVASLLLGILAASRSNNIDTANAVMTGGQAAAIQGQLNFSRDMEREADRIGYGVLTDAGFAGAGMAAMFEKLDVATRLNDSGGFPYLRSHPLTLNRVAEARNRALLVGGAAPEPTLQHTLMQARARVLMDDSASSLQRIDGASASTTLSARLGALYAGALAASLLRDHARAEDLSALALKAAATASPRDALAERSLGLLQAEVRLARGDAAAALRSLDRMPATPTPKAASRAARTSAERAPLLLRARAVLELDRAAPGSQAVALRAGTEALQTWVSEQAHDALAWELLAASSGALGLKLRSMRAAAEARYVVGDLTGAVDRLRAAQQTAQGAKGQDFIEASVIDARLRHIVAQRRQLQLEARQARGERGGTPDEPPPQ